MKHWLIPATILGLSLLSILTLMSIAPALAPRQLIFFMLGFVLFFIVSRIPFKRLLAISPIFYATTVVLLVAVLFIASITRGTARWIDVGGFFAIQPSQLAFPAAALFILHFFKNRSLLRVKNLLLFLIVVAIPAILILIEPDLGTTLVYLASLGTILFLSKTKTQYLMVLLAVGLIGAALSWNFILKPYQKERISSFISAEDTQGSSYNARQSLIAVGSGKVTGQGLGHGIQSHLRFLPERQTDFIFASFAEEFGFVGSTLVLVLYGTLIFTTISTAQKSNEYTEVLFCYVVVVMMTIQIGVNIGMNMGMLPITGITLPFLSYGGSSILSLIGIFGIIQSIRTNQTQQHILHLS